MNYKKSTYSGFCIPKIWQILKHFTGGHFIKHKPLISEEWEKQKMMKTNIIPILFLFFQNMSVEVQLENHGEFSHDFFKMQVDKVNL